jgi:hypothetical protein
MTHVTTIYRTYDGDRGLGRPPYFNKLLALQRFLLSWRRLPESQRRLIVALNTPTMPAEFMRLFDRYADDVRYIAARGNTKTYRTSLRWIEEMPDDGLAYLAEDDYLYLPEALPELVVAADTLSDCEYFTPYDHFDRYTRRDDSRFGRRESIRVAGQRHWRTVDSTCSTYLSRVSTMRTDARIHIAVCYTGRVRDRPVWRLMQGIGPFFWKLPKRRLLGPIPSLATHLDGRYIAPLIDWAARAEQTTEEARALL